MKTQNVSTLKINKMSQAQYERELAAGRIKEDELYLTPDISGGSGSAPTKTSDLINDSNFVANLDISTNLRGKTIHIRSLVEKDDSGIIVFRAGDAYIENSAYYDSYSDDNTGGWFGGQEPWEKYEFDVIVNFPDDKDYIVRVYDTNYIKAAIVYSGIEVEGGGTAYTLEQSGGTIILSGEDGSTSSVTLIASDVGADASGTASSAVSSHNKSTSAHADIRTAIEGKANKSEGAFFIEGSGTTDSTAKTSTWTGTSDRITEYYDGLTLRYKIGVAGQTTTTLNINGLGAKPIYLYNTTKLTTQFPVNSIINLIYHTGLNSGCWMCSDYDSNTNTQQRVYVTTTNTEYPITARYNTTTGSSYYAE